MEETVELIRSRIAFLGNEVREKKALSKDGQIQRESLDRSIHQLDSARNNLLRVEDRRISHQN